MNSAIRNPKSEMEPPAWSSGLQDLLVLARGGAVRLRLRRYDGGLALCWTGGPAGVAESSLRLAPDGTWGLFIGWPQARPDARFPRGSGLPAAEAAAAVSGRVVLRRHRAGLWIVLRAAHPRAILLEPPADLPAGRWRLLDLWPQDEQPRWPERSGEDDGRHADREGVLHYARPENAEALERKRRKDPRCEGCGCTRSDPCLDDRVRPCHVFRRTPTGCECSACWQTVLAQNPKSEIRNERSRPCREERRPPRRR